MNGEALLGLNLLTQIDLRSNICINRGFSQQGFSISSVPLVVSKHCSFCKKTNCEISKELSENEEKNVDMLKNFMFKQFSAQTTLINFTIVETTRTFLNAFEAQTMKHAADMTQTFETILNEINTEKDETRSEKEKVQLQNEKLLSENAKLQFKNIKLLTENENLLAKVEELLSEKEKFSTENQEFQSQNSLLQEEVAVVKTKLEAIETCEAQMNFISKLQKKLETQWAATCDANNDELRKQMDRKEEEIKSLKNKLQA